MKNFITQAKPHGFYGMKATTLTRWCFGLVFLLTGLSSYGQVALNRTFSSSTGTYTPIAGGTLVATATPAATADDNIYNVPAATIPFNFTFNGIDYTGLNISSNGFITFGATAPTAATYTPISAALGYAGAVSAFGRDLQGGYSTAVTRTNGSNVVTVSDVGPITVGDSMGNSSTGFPNGTTVTAISGNTLTLSNPAISTGANAGTAFYGPWSEIRYQTLGSAPNRVFVIQWQNFRRFGTTLGTSQHMILNFQVRLHETSHLIEVVYGNCTPGLTTLTTVNQVGLRSATNAFATNVNNRLNVKGTSDWATSTVGTVNTSGQVFNNVAPANVIPNGLTYSWAFTPPTTAMDFNNIQFIAEVANLANGSSTSFSIQAGNAVRAYTRGYELDVTEAPGAGAGISAWIGYNLSTNPANPSDASWTWVPATFNVQVGNNDEFQANLPLLGAGTYNIASRWQLGGGPFTYGGTAGFWNAATSPSIQLIYTPNPTQCADLVLPVNEAVDVPYTGPVLTWTAPVSGPTPTGYQVWWGTDPEALVNIGTVPGLTATVNTVLGSTVYYWQIVPISVIGGSAEGCPVRSLTTSVNPFAPYCSTSNYGTIEPITLVNFAGINYTAANTVATPALGGVSHVNAIATTGSVGKGKTVNITLKGNTDGNFINHFRVFIDWNQDGDFIDAGETFTAGTVTNSTGLDALQAVTAITVPATALSGTTRMRVKKLWSGDTGFANINNPCVSGQFGQTVDLSLNIFNAETLNQTSGEIDYAQAFAVTGNIQIPGLTTGAGQGAGVTASIGMSFTNTNPNTWASSHSWKSLAYSTDAGDADVYGGNVGPNYQDGVGNDVFFWSPGVYYYATRFVEGANTTYGGVAAANVGGTWNGTTFNNGILKIRTQVRPSQNGATNTTLTTPINAVAAVGATMYYFEFRDNADNSLVGEYSNATPAINFSALGVNATNRTYSIRVRAELGMETIGLGAAALITLNNMVGLPQLRPSQCGLTVAANNTTVVLNAVPVSGATNYEFEVTINGGAPQLAQSMTGVMNFSQLTSLPGRSAIIAVRVRAFSSGIWTAFGNSCNLFTATTITAIRASQCGQTWANNTGTVINAIPVAGATAYDFQVIVNGGAPQTISGASSSFNFGQLSTLPGIGATIAIRVRATVNTIVGAWSATCTVFTPSPADEDFSQNLSSNAEMTAYPNPFTNQFTLKLVTNSEASIQIFDINGRLITNQTVNDSYDVELGQNLTAGVYLVRVEQNNETQTFKMIKK